MSVVTEIERIKNNIANTYFEAGEKGATLPDKLSSDNLANTIRSIDEWRPQPDWWDIDRILEEDTEDYPYKMIILCKDTYPTFSFNAKSFKKIKFSDGTVVENPEDGVFMHEWNAEFDKQCRLGYNTRYLIIYTDIDNTNWGNGYFCVNEKGNFTQPLFIICKLGRFNQRAFFYNMYNLQCVKFIDTYISTSNSSGFTYCYSLEKIENMKWLDTLQWFSLQFGSSWNLSDLEYAKFQLPSNCSNNVELWEMWNSYKCQKNVKMPTTIDFSKVKAYHRCFSSYNIETIDYIDFTSAITVDGFNNNCLTDIAEIRGEIKCNLNLANCLSLNKATLLRVINALADFSTDTETTYTLTLRSY